MATLVAGVPWNGLKPLESGFLSGFLPVLAKRLQSNESVEERAMPQVALLGGAFVGRSTVVNLLAGEIIDGCQVISRRYWLPVAVRLGSLQDAANPVPFPALVEKKEYRWVVATRSSLESGVVVWDVSDAITHQSLAGGIKCLGEILGTSDVVVMIVSAENYADKRVHRLLEWCVRSGCLPIAVVNKVGNQSEEPLVHDIKQIMAQRLPGETIPLVMIPQADPEEITAGIGGNGRLAGARNALTLELANAAKRALEVSPQSRRGGIVRVLSHFLNEQTAWTNLLENFNKALKSSVDRGRLDAEDSLVEGARARLRAAGFSQAGKNLLESLELPGHGRAWSLLFRLAGWPLRQWLVGSGGSVPLEEVESVLARALGTWKARVQLEMVSQRNDLLSHGHVIQNSARRNAESRELPKEVQAKAAEIDAVLVQEANLRAVDLLNERPRLLGSIRALIAIVQGACLFAAIWYGSGGLLSLPYLAVFAGLADLVLVLSVRLPLYLIERSSRTRWLERMRNEIIKPFTVQLTREIQETLGPVHSAYEAWMRARITVGNSGQSGNGRP